MQQKDNPYSPGAGRIPAALVGRDEQIGTWESELARIEGGRDSRPMALYGLRGIGKTVLLTRMHELALAKDWISVMVESVVSKSLREQISGALSGALIGIAKPSAGERVKSALTTALSFSATIGTPLGFSVGIDLSGAKGSNADTGNISIDLSALVKDLSIASEGSGTGVALLVDESQDLSVDELSAISEIAHKAAQGRWRFVLALAGLPSLPIKLAKAKSYAERLYEYHEIRPLSKDDARKVLEEPSTELGVTWASTASKLIIEQSGGYPYFLQEYGSACWLLADNDKVTARDARNAIGVAQEFLDRGFFHTRWERTTPSQKTYLQAMAVDESGESTVKDISDRIGTDITNLSMRRAELIKKGIIYSPKQGVVAFTVPMMSQFIRRQHIE